MKLVSAPVRSTVSLALRPLGTRTVAVRGGEAAGARMRLRLAREKAYWFGVYEPAIQAALAAAPAGPVAFDVGANVGFFSLVLGRRFERVVAVEASPRTFPRLAETARLNPDCRIVPVHAAVAARPGRVRIRVHAEEPAMDAVADEGVEVDAVTLDELADRYGTPTLVKLDVEGAELAALEGASRLLEAAPTVVLEAHGDAGAAAVDLLAERGLRARWLDPTHALCERGS